MPDAQHELPGAYIVAVAEDADSRNRVAEALNRRYGNDYQVVCKSSSAEAMSFLETVCGESERVALVLAEQWMTPVTGDELLARVRALDPRTKRGLLVEFGAWADAATAGVILDAMARGHIDYYVLKPWRFPDEIFHRTVAEFLFEWARGDTTGPMEVTVIGRQWAPRSHELRSLLWRNGVPHAFHETDSPEGRKLLAEAGIEATDRPVVIPPKGDPIVDPTNAQVAETYGVKTEIEGDEVFDVAIVGAGPAGLAAAVSASSEGLRTLVVERESIGGQAGSSSLIRNYLGFARGVTGAELAQRAYQQAWVFGTKFLLMREVLGIEPGSGTHELVFSDGKRVSARSIVLATGVSYRRLDIPSLDRFAGTGVFYGASVSEARGLAGEDVYVVGGGNSAGQAAVNLARYAREVVIVVRSGSLEESMSRYLIDQIAAIDNIEVLPNTEVVDASGDTKLTGLTLLDRGTGEKRGVDAAALFILIGARPRIDWLPDEMVRDEWGFILTGAALLEHPDPAAWTSARRPFHYETSVAGIFAVGDVRSESVKRVAAAVGDGSVVVQDLLRYVSTTVAGAASDRG